MWRRSFKSIEQYATLFKTAAQVADVYLQVRKFESLRSQAIQISLNKGSYVAMRK